MSAVGGDGEAAGAPAGQQSGIYHRPPQQSDVGPGDPPAAVGERESCSAAAKTQQEVTDTEKRQDHHQNRYCGRYAVARSHLEKALDTIWS